MYRTDAVAAIFIQIWVTRITGCFQSSLGSKTVNNHDAAAASSLQDYKAKEAQLEILPLTKLVLPGFCKDLLLGRGTHSPGSKATAQH